MKKALLAFAALILIGSAFAQAKIPLAISCNESNADVYINDQPMAKTARNLVLRLPAGSYSVRVTKPGFQDYVNTQVVLKAIGGTALKVTLTPAGGAATAPGIVKPSPVPTKPEPVPSRPATVVDSGPATAPVVVKQAPAPVVANSPVVVNAPPAVTVVESAPQPAPAAQQRPFNVTKNSTAFPLTVDANVLGAQVYINGQYIGQTPLNLSVGRGNYEIRLAAPGYQDFIQRANVRSPTRVNAILQAFMTQLSVNSNVQGAEVLINGGVVGRTPFAATLAPGAYSLIVRAPGYTDFQTDLAMSGPQSINAVLQGALASWHLVVPESFARKGNRAFNDAEGRELELWVDGVRQRDFSGHATAGRHGLRLVLGELSSDMQVDLQAGRNYVFEPFLGLNVK